FCLLSLGEFATILLELEEEARAKLLPKMKQIRRDVYHLLQNARHRKGWLTNKPLAESASSFAAEWHFLVTLCLNEARQERPHSSVSDRRSGTEGVETPHRRPPTNPRIGPPPCSELNRAPVRSIRT